MVVPVMWSCCPTPLKKLTSLIVCSNRNGSISEACPLFVAGMFADIPSYGMSDQCPPGSVKRV